MKAINIEWDINQDKDNMLPIDLDIPQGMSDEDEISDYISDTTGYCHKGFSLIN